MTHCLPTRETFSPILGMDSAGLRSRGKSRPSIEEPTTHDNNKFEDLRPPRYTIDLSLPPAKRYQHVAHDFLPLVRSLPMLFDEVVKEAHLPPPLIKIIARACLRRVYSQEETEELRGIHEVTGVKMYLLVAFNVLLDLFMGCTSGGVQVRDRTGKPRMLHFRTMDWGMDALRKVIVLLEFIEKPGGPVIAQSITYVGYVGVLTGVRKDLSMSLNFRPCHDHSTRAANFQFYFNHLLVLLGVRPSISTILRQCLFPTTVSSKGLGFSGRDLSSIEGKLPGSPTTAAYLTFCDGQRTIIIEKDHKTGAVRSSTDFDLATNHDTSEEDRPQAQRNGPTESAPLKISGMELIVGESIERKDALVNIWKTATGCKRRGSKKSDAQSEPVSPEDVIEWMGVYPITNEETHYATVMDPEAGEVVWAVRHLEPLNPEQRTAKSVYTT